MGWKTQFPLFFQSLKRPRQFASSPFPYRPEFLGAFTRAKELRKWFLIENGHITNARTLATTASRMFNLPQVKTYLLEIEEKGKAKAIEAVGTNEEKAFIAWPR
jgi:hypothetical protein